MIIINNTSSSSYIIFPVSIIKLSAFTITNTSNTKATRSTIVFLFFLTQFNFPPPHLLSHFHLFSDFPSSSPPPSLSPPSQPTLSSKSRPEPFILIANTKATNTRTALTSTSFSSRLVLSFPHHYPHHL